MSETGTAPTAWEPLTPRGVAAFARASNGRLLLVQFLVALAVAASVVWFLRDGWFPTVREAGTQLPDAGQIRSSELDWRGKWPRLLAEGTFLALSVDLDHSGAIRSPAHLYVEFGRRDVWFRSLLGYMTVKYPSNWTVALNRQEMTPWWGAWPPVLLAGVAAGVVAGLLVLWFALALVYALPVWALVFFVNRGFWLG